MVTYTMYKPKPMNDQNPTPPHVFPRMKLVNNTSENVEMFHKELFRCIEEGSGTPEELADVMFLKHIEVDGQKRGILDWI